MEYKTERGITVEVVPIPMLLDAIRKATPGPDQPVYIEKMAGGGELEVEISDADARAWQEKDPESWAEHAETWATFEVERDAAQSLLNERVSQAVYKRAVIVDLPKNDDWIADQAELGLTVPDDHRGRHLHYIKTEVVGGMKDVLKLTAIANGADLSEEALSIAEDSFRNNLAREILAGLVDQGGAVEDRAAGGADESGEGMAAATE